MEKSNTTKYGKIISKSSLITSGSPAVYQLRPNKETFESLTRLTVGEKNLKNKNKTILLVGETGTGKSTLINTLVNYTMGVKFEDNIWFEIVESERRSQSESQTSDVVVYEIFDKPLFYSLTIIDTPGYGDTRGIDHDLKISERVLDLFSEKDGIQEINAVGLVIKATENRLSDRLRYIFDSVMSLFGKDLEKNIVSLITHSDGIVSENVLQALEDLNIKCAKNEKNQPVYFMFNNCQSKQRTKETKVSIKNACKVSMGGMGEFRAFLEGCAPQKLMTSRKVVKTRHRLAAGIRNLQERISLIEQKQTEIQQNQEALKKYEEEMKNNETFSIEVNEIYKKKEQIVSGMWWKVFYDAAVCCTVCEENCHYPGCTMAWYPRDCKIMRKGRCTVCTNKCPVSAHVKENWSYVTKTRKVQKTLQEMKEKYEKNKSESGMKGTLLENLEKQMKGLAAEKDQLLEESYQLVVKLEQIALNVNSLSIHDHLDFLIEKIKEKGDIEKVQNLEKVRSGVDEETRAKLQHTYVKLKENVKK
ncbi:septin-2-like isoform X2 [Channa argus]|uniref:septin-2-like isoform X2 n=1 Tax=Channa argus TaxID=215402 RepID=UPI00352013BA